MILLRRDCLVFRTADGEGVVCSATEVAATLLGDAADKLGENFLTNAVEAVLHFFKVDLERSSVSVEEFSAALVKILRGFGLDAYQDQEMPSKPLRIAEADLRGLARDSGKGFELLFFSRLRDELRSKVGESPQVIRFRGLRSCVKQLTGARRWSPRCQSLNDQIVDYLRTCLGTETNGQNCALLVQ
jgi:hypothetical protein